MSGGRLGEGGLRVLREMLEAPDDLDILCGGIEVWVGNRRTSRRTLTALLRCAAVHFAGDQQTERYIINEPVARQIVDRPELAGEITNSILSQGGPITIRGGHVVPLDSPNPPTTTEGER